MKKQNKGFYNYFTKNLIKGFLYLAVLVILIIIFKNYFQEQHDAIEHWVSDDYGMMLVIFLISEIFVGILPPELFMIWSIDDPMMVYIAIVATMTVISLFAGWINYWVGKKISTKRFFHRIFKRRLRKFQRRYEQYGGGFIVVAALTPLPFSLISLFTGSMSYPANKYMVYSSFRILRFIVYGIIVWHLEGVI